MFVRLVFNEDSENKIFSQISQKDATKYLRPLWSFIFVQRLFSFLDNFVFYEVISYLLCSRRIPLSWKCVRAMSPGVYECNE